MGVDGRLSGVSAGPEDSLGVFTFTIFPGSIA